MSKQKNADDCFSTSTVSPINCHLNLQIYYNVMLTSKQKSCHKESIDEMVVPKLKSR